MAFLLGNDAGSLLNGQPRYFYALRRTEQGDLYVSRVDQLGNDSIQINDIGDPDDDYNKFQVGVDNFNGRGINHERTYVNLKFDQYRWDDRFLSYYIDEDGYLSAIIGKDREYPTDV